MADKGVPPGVLGGFFQEARAEGGAPAASRGVESALTEVGSGARQASPGGPPLVDLLLEVVSEKTGYPVEMLGLELELEAGLGIDSIKRVEILSALRDRAPELPEVEPSQLASLRTLQEIIDFMGNGGAATDGKAPGGLHEASEGRGPVSSSPNPGAPRSEAEAAGPAEPLDHFVVRAVAAPAAGLALPGLLGATGPIAIVQDRAGVAPLLAERLAAHGIEARCVDEVPSEAAGVLHLVGLDRPEGEATALYLQKLIRPLGVRVTRLARGLPVGGDLEYADGVTIAEALAGRREL